MGLFRELLGLWGNFWSYSETCLITFCSSLYLKILPRAWASTSHLPAFKIEIFHEIWHQGSYQSEMWNQICFQIRDEIPVQLSHCGSLLISPAARDTSNAHVPETELFKSSQPPESEALQRVKFSLSEK